MIKVFHTVSSPKDKYGLISYDYVKGCGVYLGSYKGRLEKGILMKNEDFMGFDKTINKDKCGSICANCNEYASPILEMQMIYNPQYISLKDSDSTI